MNSQVGRSPLAPSPSSGAPRRSRPPPHWAGWSHLLGLSHSPRLCLADRQRPLGPLSLTHWSHTWSYLHWPSAVSTRLPLQGYLTFENYQSAIGAGEAVIKGINKRIEAGKTIVLGAWGDALDATLRETYSATVWGLWVRLKNRNLNRMRSA